MPRVLKNPRLTKVQKSITFPYYQKEFMNLHQDFKADKYFIEAIDEQIQIIDPEFWEQIEKLKNE